MGPGPGVSEFFSLKKKFEFFPSLSFLPVDSAVYSMNLLGVCTQWEEIAVSSRNKNQPSTAGGWEGEAPSV